ncbi:MAG: hypothetical protein R3Y08_08235 [Rikenellaceae bacterium]
MPKAFKNYKDQGVVQIYLRQLFDLYNLRDAISKPKAQEGMHLRGCYPRPPEAVRSAQKASKKRTESKQEAHSKQQARSAQQAASKQRTAIKQQQYFASVYPELCLLLPITMVAVQLA